MNSPKYDGKCIWLFLAPVCLAAILLLCGCRTAPVAEIRLGPDRARPAEKEAEVIIRNVAANVRRLKTLTADVELAMVSPILYEPPQLVLTGRLALKKTTAPGRPTEAAVRLQLRHATGRSITMVGDGEDYEVDMPLLNMSYSGSYGRTLEKVEGRIHLTPVEVASAFNIEGILEGRLQTMRSYPPHWDYSAVGMRDPVEFPPLWIIDSIEIEDGVEPYPWISNSLMLDRRTEELVRVDSFRPDGSLMARIWIMDKMSLRTPDREVIRVPSELMIWYPPPLEGTVVRLRLNRIRINETLDDRIFEP